jgi:hypothetical protein
MGSFESEGNKDGRWKMENGKWKMKNGKVKGDKVNV